MKALSTITILVFLLLFLSGKSFENRYENNPDIHKSKRSFLKRNDRPYLKKNKNEVSNQSNENNTQSASVEKFIESGTSKEELQDYKGAISDFNKALLFEPKNPEVLYHCGYLKFQMEDYANALPDYDLAISNDSQSVELFYARANAKFKISLYKDAIADYDKAIKLDSTDAPSYFNRAVAKYFIGSKDLCKDFQVALKYGDREAESAIKEYCK